MGLFHVIQNPFCERCGGRPCWRALCVTCAAYLTLHGTCRDHADAAAVVEHTFHRCRPLGVPWSPAWSLP